MMTFTKDAPVFFTADPHYFHKRILEIGKLPFKSVTDKDNFQIDCWNMVVPKHGITFVLGDMFLFTNEQYLDDAKKVIERLHGRIYLIRGNHDHCTTFKHTKIEGNIFDTCIMKISDAKTHIFLSHYCHKVWQYSHYNSIHLFGHSHGALDEYARKEGKLMDVCVESNGYTPVSLQQVLKIMESRPDNYNYVRK